MTLHLIEERRGAWVNWKVSDPLLSARFASRCSSFLYMLELCVSTKHAFVGEELMKYSLLLWS